MKPRFTFRSCLAGCTLLVALSQAVHAQATYYWDNNGDASGFGTAAGTWAAPTTNNSSQGWSTDTTGATLPSGTTTTTTSDTVNFGTNTDGLAAGSITVSGTVNAGGINFGSASGGITLSAGTISIADGGTIANNSSSTAAIGSALAGSGGFIVNNGGTGSLQFTTNITNTGSMRIDNGTVLMSNAGLIGGLSKVILNGGGAKMRINITTGTNTSTVPFDLTENGGSISKGGSNTLGLSGAFAATGTGNRTLTLENNGTGSGTLSGSFVLADPGSGQLSLNKTGSGIWVLGAANTFTGSTKVTGGILSYTNSNALQNSPLDTTNSITGTTTDGLRIGTGSTLNLGGLTGNKDLGSLFNTTSGTYTSVGGITLKVASGNDFSYSGIIANGSGSTTLTKSGAGSQTLSGNNTYSGLTSVSGGTLTISGNRDLGVLAGGFRISGDAVLNLGGDHRTGADITVGYTTAGAGTLSQSAGTLRITSGNAVLLGNTGTGATGNYNLSGGTLEVTYTSTTRGVMIGANTGSGNFTLSDSGNLSLTNAALLVGRSDSSNSSGADAVFSQTGGTATVANLLVGGQTPATNPDITADLNLSGGTFSATNFLALAGGNNSISTINISGTADVTLPAFPTARGTAATATITFDGGTLRNAGASATYMQGLTNAYIKQNGAKFNTANGNITIAQNLLTDPVSMGGGLTKEGANTLTLSGSNTYTGATTISGGTLALGADNVLPDTNVSIGAATLDAATFDDALGMLNVTGAATINLGSGANLVFADSSGIVGGWAGTLNITGTFVSGSSLKFGDNANALTNAQLLKISATGFSNFALNAFGYLIADAGGNNAPGISDITDQSVPSGGNSGGLAFTVTDEDTASVTPSGSSSNPTLVPNGNIVFGGSGANRNVTVTPVSGLSGTATITVTLTDNGNLTAQDTFVLTVTDNYLSWATANNITGGEDGDSDNDGVKNLVEYALADGGERGVYSGNTITFNKRGVPYGSDLTYVIETSETLASGSWTAEVTHGPAELGSPISYTFTPGTPVREFARLKVTRP